MKKFNLSEYLENPSRKIVTRRGNHVRIICSDRKAKSGNIVGLVGEDESLIYVWDNNGNHIVSGIDENDLFFADEEDELTEFEKEVNRIVTAFSAIHAYMDKNEIHHYSKGLLDLARNELQQEFKEEYNRGYSIGKFDAGEAKVKELIAEFEKGRQSVLKDLPKWKKAKKDEELDCHVAIQQDGRVVLSDFVQKDDYYITLDVLKTLPKEE